MAAAAATGTVVFDEGPYCAVTKSVHKCQAKGLPKPVVVATPTVAGTYPVVVFLHGWNLYYSCWYQSLLKHVASHGFIAVAPQLYDHPIFNFNDGTDIKTTKAVTNWLAGDQGLLYVLSHVLKIEGVKPDLSRLAMAGHSRGGDTAFATVLGLKGKHDDTSLDLKPSALIGVDPVAGLVLGPVHRQVDPKVLTGSFNPGMPVLVIGTGLGPKGTLLELPPTPPCAPAGFNHAEFYGQCASSPRYTFTAKDYGHLDMLDDDVPLLITWMCNRNPEQTKELCRRAMGGLVVAFLWAALEGKGQDLEAVLQNPGLAPAVLDQIDHHLP